MQVGSFFRKKSVPEAQTFGSLVVYLLLYYLPKVLSLKSKTPETDTNCAPHWPPVGAEVSATETDNGKINRREVCLCP